MESCLCLADTSAFRGSIFDGFLDAGQLDLTRTTFVSSSGREDFSNCVSDQKFDSAFSHAEAPKHHGSALISQIASCLRPGGHMKVSEPEASTAPTTTMLCWLSHVMVRSISRLPQRAGRRLITGTSKGIAAGRPQRDRSDHFSFRLLSRQQSHGEPKL